MALEDVLNALGKYGKIKSIDETLAKDSTNPEAYNSFGAYNVEYEGIDPNTVQNMIRNLRVDPVHARGLAGTARARDQTALVERVSEHYDEMASALDSDDLAAFAIDLPDESKKYHELEAAMRNNDLKKAKAIFADAFESEIWKEYVMDMQDKDAGTLLKAVSAKYRNDFIKEKLSDEVTKEGKKTYTLNPEKTRSYVVSKMREYEGGLKDLTHIQLAGLYAKAVRED